jgi:VanZ family protein
VAGWLLVIWGTIPLAGAVREFVAVRGGRHLFLWATLFALAAVGVRLLQAATRRGLTPARLLVLAAVAALYAGLVWSLRHNTEEALHCVQYAVLGTLLSRALGRHLGGLTGYAAAAMAGIGLGIIDELIQWLVPGRTFDYRDLGINGLSAVLALAAVAVARGHRPVRRRARLRDWRPVLLLAAADLLLLLFCLSNTPELQRRYARLLPAAVALDGVTAEYGYRHVDAVAGVFRSRLDRAELARQDRERGAEVAVILDRYAGEEQYRAFLARYPAHQDPLMVEARVHLFRRDRYAFLADQARDDPALRQQYARIAMGENRLMETVFPAVLGHSGYVWPEAMGATLAAWAGPAAPYESPVSGELITVASRPVLQGLLVVLLALTLWAARRVGRAHGAALGVGE